MSSYKDTLETELMQYVSNLARKAGATMVGRPRVFVSSIPSVPLKQVRVQARLVSARSSRLDVTRTQEMPDVASLEQQIPTFVLFDGYRRMPISEAIVNIGRSLDNDIVLDDKRVSRRHAQLRRRYEQYVLYDLDSTGGTTVNGIRIREAVLQPDDVIAFAGIKVQFERADALSLLQDADSDPAATRILPGRL
jgi:pSer/pThr/pTyr-binding forkhead associated (FHA) protein